MSAGDGRRRHRKRQHEHALERLRERYFPDATMEDVVAIRDAARMTSAGRPSLNGWSEGVGCGVLHRGVNVQVIYSRLYDSVRTVLPGMLSTPPRITKEGE